MKQNKTLLEWNIKKLSDALHLSEEDVKKYFMDGRRVSFLIERRLIEVIGGRLPESEGEAYDLIDKNNNKWEVRSISKNIYFCPSYMVGSGRSFEEKGFLEKLNKIKGYIISDIKLFPKIPFWIINKEIVLSWWKEGKLGNKTFVSRKRIYELLKEL